MNLSTALKFGYHAVRMKANRSYRVPLDVTVQLLRKCLFKCLYCPGDDASEEMLSRQVIFRLFREIRAMGGLRIHLTGGEPMLRDDLREIISEAKGLGFFVSMRTSGLRAAEQVSALKLLDEIQLSYDGPPEVRGAIGGDVAARVGDEALAVLRERGLPFRLVAVLTRLSIPHITWVVDRARDYHARVEFVPMQALAEEWDASGGIPECAGRLLPSEDENHQAVGRIIRLKLRGIPIASSLPYLEALLDWDEYPRTMSQSRRPSYRCMAWQSRCEIRADGEMRLCNWTAARGRGISVVAGGFRRAWERLERPDDCRSCIAPRHLEANLLLDLNRRAIMERCRALFRR